MAVSLAVKLVALLPVAGLAYLIYICPCDSLVGCHKSQYYSLIAVAALLPSIL